MTSLVLETIPANQQKTAELFRSVLQQPEKWCSDFQEF